jgi:hypothetical protein
MRIEEEEATEICDFLHNSSEGCKLGRLRDVFCIKDKQFMSGRFFGYAIFKETVNESDLREMKGFSDFISYLNAKIPSLKSAIGIVEEYMHKYKICPMVSIGMQGTKVYTEDYKGSLPKVDIYNDCQDLANMFNNKADEPLYVYNGDMSENLVSNIYEKREDIVQMYDTKLKKMRYIKYLDFYNSVMEGRMLVERPDDAKIACSILKQHNNLVPLMMIVDDVQSNFGLGDKVVKYKCLMLDDLVELLDIGFNYYQIVSNKRILDLLTRHIGLEPDDEWDSERAFQDFQRVIALDQRPDKFCKMRFSSSWLSRLNMSQFNDFLSRCDIFYLGGQAQYWDWIFVGNEGKPIDTFEVKQTLLYLAPKIYKLMVLCKSSKVYSSRNNPLKFVQEVMKKYCLCDWSEKVFRVSFTLYRINVTCDLKPREFSPYNFQYLEDYIKEQELLQLMNVRKKNLRVFCTSVKVNGGTTFLCYSQNRKKIDKLRLCYDQIYKTGDLVLNVENLSLMKDAITDDCALYLILQGLYVTNDYRMVYSPAMREIYAESGEIVYVESNDNIVIHKCNILSSEKCILYTFKRKVVCEFESVENTIEITDIDLSGEEFYIT